MLHIIMQHIPLLFYHFATQSFAAQYWVYVSLFKWGILAGWGMTWALLIPIKVIKNAHFQRASEAVVSMLGTRLFSETQAKTSLLP